MALPTLLLCYKAVDPCIKREQWFSTFATVTTVYCVPINCKLALISLCSIHQYRLVTASSKITSPSGRDWDAIILILSHSTIEPLSKMHYPNPLCCHFTQNISSDIRVPKCHWTPLSVCEGMAYREAAKGSLCCTVGDWHGRQTGQGYLHHAWHPVAWWAGRSAARFGQNCWLLFPLNAGAP